MQIIKPTSKEELKEIYLEIEELKKSGNSISITYDTEATGKDVKTSRLLEFGAIINVNGKEYKTIQVYFNPWLEDKKLYMPKDAYNIHGIDKDFLEGEKTLGNKGEIQLQKNSIETLKSSIDLILKLVTENTTITHNGKVYDINLLLNEGQRYKSKIKVNKLNIILDTLFIMRKDLSKEELTNENLEPKYTLDNLVKYLENKTGLKCEIKRNLHGALEDSLYLNWALKQMPKIKDKQGNYIFKTLINQIEIIKEAKGYKKTLIISKIITLNKLKRLIKKTKNKIDEEKYKNLELKLKELENKYETSTEEDKKEANNIIEATYFELLEQIPKEKTNINLLFRTDQTINICNSEECIKEIGSNDIEEYFQEMRENGYVETTIMDIIPSLHNKATELAKKYKIKLNYGTTLTLKINEKEIKLNLFAKTELGYNNMLKLITLSTVNNNLNPYILLENLKNNSDDILITTSNNIKTLKNLTTEELEKLNNVIKDFRIEIENKEQYDLLKELYKNNKNQFQNFKYIYTHMSLYTKKEDYELKHKPRLAGFLKKTINEVQSTENNNYLMQKEELETKYNKATIKENNKMELNYIPQQQKPKMPKYKKEEKYESVSEELKEKAFNGLEARFDELKINNQKLKEKYKQRLIHELNILEEMKEKSNGEIDFNAYMLLVSDYVVFAKEVGLLVGPGRGSAAGSLLAYSLNITNIDPIKYNLSFERFLNPERVGMPDIDVDFAGYLLLSDLKKEEIEKKYPNIYNFFKFKLNIKDEDKIEAKKALFLYRQWYYDADKGNKKPEEISKISQVANILTLGEYKPKSAIETACRILGTDYAMSLGFSDNVELSNYIKKNIVKEASNISEILENKENEQILNNDLLYKIFVIAEKLENTVRSNGIHAAGVFISENTEKIIINSNNEPVSMKTMFGGIEEEFVKFDDLGLKIQELIDETKKLSKIKEILLEEDKKVFQTISNYPEGMFQISGSGISEFIKEFKPESMEDLIAILALYRPGPMESGMLESYLKRKKGEENIEYTFPVMEETLKNTYGVIVYQEQVMEIVQKVGGFSLGYADIIRRAMGKKKDMTKYNKEFSEGAVKNGYDYEEASKLFNSIEKFAGYGFNKSHSAAYATVTYQTAWLKTYYPIEFATARLNYRIDDKAEDFAKIIQSIEKENIKIEKPDIENFTIDFKPKNGKILFSYKYIVGENASNKIEKLLKENPDLSREEKIILLMQNLDKGAIEKLIKAGDLKLNNETMAEVNEKFYTIRNNMKSQYEEVIEKIINTKNNNKKLIWGNLLKTTEKKWNKKSWKALLKNSEILEKLSPKELKEMENKMLEMEKEKKIDFFPNTDFEIWETETKTLGKSFSVIHPLLSEYILELYKKNKGKIIKLSNFINEFNEKSSEEKEEYIDNKKQINTIGIVSNTFETTSKKGNELLIIEVITENNEKLIVMAMKENYEKFKKTISNNEIIRFSGNLIFSKEKGLALMLNDSESLQNDIEQNTTKIQEYYVETIDKNNNKILKFNKITEKLKKILEDNNIKLYGNYIYINETNKQKIKEILKNNNILETEDLNNIKKQEEDYKPKKIDQQNIKNKTKEFNNTSTKIVEENKYMKINEKGNIIINSNNVTLLIKKEKIIIQDNKVYDKVTNKEIRGIFYNEQYEIITITGFNKEDIRSKIKEKFIKYFKEIEQNQKNKRIRKNKKEPKINIVDIEQRVPKEFQALEYEILNIKKELSEGNLTIKFILNLMWNLYLNAPDDTIEIETNNEILKNNLSQIEEILKETFFKKVQQKLTMQDK